MASVPLDKNSVCLEFGPGSIEYEITADFLQYSLESIHHPTTTQFAAAHLPPKRQWRLNSMRINPIPSHTEKNSEIFTYESTITENPPNYGKLAFFTGFLLPFVWWIFAIFPRQPTTKYQATWRFWNRIFALISILFFCIFLPVYLTQSI